MRIVTLSTVLVLALSFSASASTVDLLNYQLRSLQTTELHTMERYRGKMVAMMLFKPDCPWCAKQVRVFNTIIDRCDHLFQPLAVGVDGARRALRKELARLRPKFPVYQASRELQKDVGEVEATPMTLIGNSRGEFLVWRRGYTRLPQMLSLVKKVTGQPCE